jgi:hypothetical protein
MFWWLIHLGIYIYIYVCVLCIYIYTIMHASGHFESYIIHNHIMELYIYICLRLRLSLSLYIYIYILPNLINYLHFGSLNAPLDI